MHELHLGSGREIRLSIEWRLTGKTIRSSCAYSDWTRWSVCWDRERPENQVESGSGGSGAREPGKIQYRPRRVEEVTPRAALASARALPTFPEWPLTLTTLIRIWVEKALR